MDARKLANYLIALQELGGLSWDSQVKIEINGKENELADYTGHQMPDNNPDHWYYLLRAVVPPPGKTIDWPAVEDKIRKRIYEEYQRANSMITDASLHVSLEDNITLIDSEKSTNTLIEFIRKELGL